MSSGCSSNLPLHWVDAVFLLFSSRDQEQAEDGLVEAYRLLQSTLYKMYLLIEENSLLQSLVARFAKQEVKAIQLREKWCMESWLGVGEGGVDGITVHKNQLVGKYIAQKEL